MIVFPVPSDDNGPLSGLPTFYHNGGKHGLRFEIDRAEDGAITIHRELSADFDRRYTDIVIPPIGKIIEVRHKVMKMIPEWRYVYETPDHHAIAMLAKHIMSCGFMDEESAKQLSGRIDMELSACKEKRIGRTVQAGGGWREAIRRCADDAVADYVHVVASSNGHSR